MVNEGKRLENNFRGAFTPNRIIRLYDTTNGYKGVANPCDFIVLGDSKTILVECKSVSSQRLPFANITENQWNGLLAHRNRHVVSGILIEFRAEQLVYFVDIATLEDIKKNGVKSISIHECNRRALRIPVEYARTNFSMDGEQFIIICERYFRYSDVIH